MAGALDLIANVRGRLCLPLLTPQGLAKSKPWRDAIIRQFGVGRI
jgi:hypothetical protein